MSKFSFTPFGKMSETGKTVISAKFSALSKAPWPGRASFTVYEYPNTGKQFVSAGCFNKLIRKSNSYVLDSKYLEQLDKDYKIGGVGNQTQYIVTIDNIREYLDDQDWPSRKIEQAVCQLTNTAPPPKKRSSPSPSSSAVSSSEEEGDVEIVQRNVKRVRLDPLKEYIDQKLENFTETLQGHVDGIVDPLKNYIDHKLENVVSHVDKTVAESAKNLKHYFRADIRKKALDMYFTADNFKEKREKVLKQFVESQVDELEKKVRLEIEKAHPAKPSFKALIQGFIADVSKELSNGEPNQ